MKLNDIIIEMPEQTLQPLENAIDQMFRTLGLDIVFTQHFKNRILDNGSEARDTDVTAKEIFSAFNALKVKYGKQLYDARSNPKEFHGLLKDISTDLNMPFAIDYQRVHNGLHKLKVITLMRKKNFKSDNFDSIVMPVQSKG